MLQNLQKLSSTLWAITIMLAFSTLTMSEAFTQTIRYVKPGGTGNGTSWANASGNLQAMINASVANDQVWVAAGTYKPTTGTDRTLSFTMKNGVAIYGGFAGTENPLTFNLSDRDFAANETILSGDVGTTGDNSDNSYHVIFNSDIGITATAILDGFTITGGNANDGTGTNSVGGGMYNRYSSPSLVNCNFSDNSASSTTSYRGGGGMYNRDNSPSLVNCNFSGNSADGTEYSGGGGMYNRNSSPSLVNCSFLGNFASGGGYCGGAGIFNYESSPSLVNCIFLGNRTSTWDGEFSGGAGMFNYISTTSLVNCSFSGNYARSIISNSGGGGILNNASTTSLVNCIIWNNRIINDTTSTRASIYNIGFSATTISYSLIANSGGSGSWDVKIGTNGGNNIDADPLFKQDVSLASMPTTTGNLRLKVNSPAIDAGSNGAVPAGVTTDLDGESRIYNGGVDMGAYEFQGETCTNPTSGGEIEADQVICYNTAPASITNKTLPSGHTGILNYRWQKSIVDPSDPNFEETDFSDISNTNTDTYLPGSVSQTTWFRRLARVDCMNDWDGAAKSNTVTISVYDAFTPGAIEATGETICYGNDPAEIGSSTDASGGDETITYAWYSSLDNFVNDSTLIDGAVSAAYDPPTGLMATTSYRRYAHDGTCNTDFEVSTGTWTVNVYDDFTPGAIGSTGETICYGDDPVEIGSDTDASGGDETITYAWYSSIDNFVNDSTLIDGAVSAAYDPPTGLMATTSYRRYAHDGTCNTDFEVSTGTWTVNVYDDFTPGAIGSTGETICYGDDPVEIGSDTDASGGDETITYAWYSSLDNFVNDSTLIDGAVSAAYDPPTGLTDTTSYRRYAKDSKCNTNLEPSTGTWTVNPEPVPVTGTLSRTPDQDTVCEGADVSAALTSGSGGNDTDSTYYRTNTSAGWSAWAAYTSETDISTSGKTGVEIRTKRKASYCTDASWTTVSWTVEQTPVSGTLAKTPDIILICQGDDVSATLTPGSGGNGTDSLAYRTYNGNSWTSWQSYTSGSDIPTDEVTQIEILTLRVADYCVDAKADTVRWSADVTPPVVTENTNVTVTLDPTGNYTLLTDDLLDSYTDAGVGIKSVSIEPEAVTCADLGLKNIAVTVADNCDNETVVNMTITVSEGTDLGDWEYCNTQASASGTSTYSPCTNNGTFYLTSKGKSTSTSDVMHFVYKNLTGNGTIIARLADVKNDGWAGVMMRESCAPGSRTVLFKTRLYNPNVLTGYRKLTDKTIYTVSQVYQQIRWMKIQRNGNTFLVYVSYNGTTWIKVYTTNIAMNNTIMAGIFTENFFTNRTTQAWFDHVELSNLLKTSEDFALTEWVESEISDLDFEVYPNPAINEVTIVATGNTPLTGSTATLISAEGKLVLVFDIKDPIVKLNLNGLLPGIYALRIQIDDKIVVKRLVIQ